MATTLVAPYDMALMLGTEATDPLVTAACHRASGAFIGAIGYDPSRAVREFALTARKYDTLMLPAAPLNEVQSLVDRTTGEDLDYAYFDRDSATITRPRGVRWPTRWKAIQVVADTGFDEIPYAIVDAVMERAVILYNSPDPTISQVSEGSRSYSTAIRSLAGVTQKWSDAVEHYRRIVAD